MEGEFLNMNLKTSRNILRLRNLCFDKRKSGSSRQLFWAYISGEFDGVPVLK